MGKPGWTGWQTSAESYTEMDQIIPLQNHRDLQDNRHNTNFAPFATISGVHFIQVCSKIVIPLSRIAVYVDDTKNHATLTQFYAIAAQNRIDRNERPL